MGTTYWMISRSMRQKVYLGKMSENVVKAGSIICLVRDAKDIEIVSEHDPIAEDYDAHGNTTLDDFEEVK